MDKDLVRLGNLTRMSLDAALFDLSKIADKEAQLRLELGSLRQNASHQDSATDILDPAQILAVEKWLKWRQARTIEVNRKLALCLAEKSHFREVAKLAFGRNHVVQALLEKSGQR